MLVRTLLCLFFVWPPSVANAETLVQKIIETDRRPPHKVSFDVILKNRIEKPEMEIIAKAIKAQNQDYRLVFIGYFIEGTNHDSGYWGTSHWTGDTVQIVPGPSEAEIAKRREVCR